MKGWHRAFLRALLLFVCFGGHTPAAPQQAPPSSDVLLLNLIKNANEIQIYKRDAKVSGGWRKHPTLHLKAARDAPLFRALREAEVTKPRGLDPADATWRFEFVRNSTRTKKLGEALSDGKLLDRKGDAAITLPPEWVKKLR